MNDVRFPSRLMKNLSVQHIGEETLVYDETRHAALCLDRITAVVWNHCDGHHSVARIAVIATVGLGHPVTEDMVVIALAQLDKDGLLQPANASFANLGAMSRRRMMSKLGASAVLLLPVVSMVLAPSAAQAYNGCVDCSPNARRGVNPAAQPTPAYPAATPKKTDNAFGITND